MAESFEKLSHFFSKYKRLAYRKHELIIRADDIPSGVYFIHKGYVRRYALSESGQELSQIIFKPQDFFPIIWAITDSPNVQYCESITKVELSRAPRKEFTDFLIDNPDVLYEVLNRMLTRFEGVLERMEYMAFGNAYQKVASILVICAERFGIKKGREIVIRVPLTHKDIGNLAGLTRETTSVEVKKLDKEKLISKKNGLLRVHNVEKLKDAAQWHKFV